VALSIDTVLSLICNEIIEDFFEEGFGPPGSGGGGETALPAVPRPAGIRPAAMPTMPMLPPIDPALAGQSPLTIADNVVLGHWMQLFAAHPGGQFYLDAFTSHALELKTIFETHDELRDRGRRLMIEFFPALALLVTGRGEHYVLSGDLMARARAMWQGIAAVASPAMAAFINAELAKFHNLDDFVGLNMNQWALALGVDTGGALATGTVHVGVAPTTGTWTLTRPDNSVTTGTGAVTLAAQPVGQYRIDWPSLPGYGAPLQITQQGILAANDSLAFLARYRTQLNLDIVDYLLGHRSDPAGLDTNGDGKVDVGDLVRERNDFQ
jgi:hypothetical protein